MSNVRSSSHVSIYNYPEHLNPFYDDDQHKRLRFWKIVGNKSHQPSGRRGSFNLGSLKDLLPLKSLGFKKRSSTLGINKTSESPPPLRRTYDGYNSEIESNYSTFDKRIGYSTNNDFIRSSRYRSSLQNMNSVSPLGIRNEPSRATMQYGTSRPIPATRTNYLTTQRGMTPGSSMNSISTNPFETDDSDADFSSSVTGVKRLRKKRRAPLPPSQTNVHLKVSEEEAVELKINENSAENDGLKELTRLTAEFESFMRNSKDDIVVETSEKPESSGELTIVESSEKPEPKRELNIVESSNVHSVDENFNNVRKKSPEKVVIETIEVKETQSPVFEKVSTTFHYQNNVRPDVYIAPQRLEPDVEHLPTSSREETPDYIPVPVREKFHVLRIDEKELNEDDVVKHKSQLVAKRSPEVVHVNTVEVPATHEVTHKVVQECIKPAQQQQAQQNAQFAPEAAQRKHDIVRSSPIAAKRTQVMQIAPNVAQRASNVVQVTPAVERKESEAVKEEVIISSPSNQVVKTAQDVEQPLLEQHKQEEDSSSATVRIQTVTRIREETPIPRATTETITKVEAPIQFFEDIETFIRKKEYQNDDEIYDPDHPPKPPERRRSVKDIIESINRSQQLLRTSTPQFEKKYNFNSQKFSYHEKPVVPPKPNSLLKFQRQAESEKRINELLADLQDFNKNNQELTKDPKFPYVSEDVVNNNIVTERIRSGEFNPIPKPKRSLDSS